MLEVDTVVQGRFRIIRQIGKGGMGTVYLARDENLGVMVALKQNFFDDARLIEAFKRESRLLAGLRHSALPQVKDYFINDTGQYLVMEYIAGDDFGDLLEKRKQRIEPVGEAKPFEVSEVVQWAEQLLDALDYLHTRSEPVIHRDIKPQNLKLAERNQIILLDFGLAKGKPQWMTRVTTTGSIHGYTPHYAPLEQIRGVGTDPRSDLYALGATLYHLLTGAPPVDATTRADVFLGGEPDPLRPANEVNPQVPREIANVLMKAMEQHRNKRPATAAEMLQILRAAKYATVLDRQERETEIIVQPEIEARKQAEAAQKAREAAEHLRMQREPEERERRAQEEAERKARAEQERRARQEAEEQRQREEEERRAREAAERKRQQEEEARQAKEAAERPARAEAERRQREAAEALLQQREQEERERQAREAAEALQMRREQEARERRAREAAVALRQEQERQAREEAERLRQQKEKAKRTNQELPVHILAPPMPEQPKAREPQAANYATPLRKQGLLKIAIGLALMGVIILVVIIMSKTSDSPSSALPESSPSANPQAGTETGALKELASRFVPIAAGEFEMGAQRGEDDERPAHHVRISRSFEMGKYEVTQAQWEAVMSNNPSNFKGANLPVEQVSWNDTQQFIQKLNARNDGYTYRLPTEAEWEYACRAGLTEGVVGNLDALAWYDKNADHQTHPVGEKQPNAWGLYDMHGNVLEWCQDWYSKDYYAQSPSADPPGPATGSERVFRGGSWNYEARYCRSAYRNRFAPDFRRNILGFRLVRTPR